MRRRSPFLKRVFGLLAIGTSVMLSSCAIIVWKMDPRAVNLAALPDTATTPVRSSVKVHLKDGSTMVFASGAMLSRTRITGAAVHYPLLKNAGVPRGEITMDSVVAVEVFSNKVQSASSLVLSLAATAAAGFGSALLLVAIFGSCPTVYSDSAGGPVLEAEGFSYAIAPLFEQRDVDPLRLHADNRGIVRLELRNEALETHYINHMELLAARHAPGERIVPDHSGRPVSVSSLRAVVSAVDRSGRDVRGVLANADGKLFSTVASTSQAARVGDLNDWIDITADSLPPGDSVAVVLRLRNSMLNTVLLYEGVLGGRDAADWLSQGIQHIGYAVDFSRWYARTMGMHATVAGVPARTGADSGMGLARLGDVGPIAFRDVAMVLPRQAHDASSTQIRLRFVADNWRIDQVQIGGRVSRPVTVTVPVARVIVPTPETGTAPMLDTAALRALANPDDQYLETRPGQRMKIEFNTGVGDASTTYLLAWQGWYREWIRASWIASPTRTTPFVPGDSAVLTALGRWRSKQVSLERTFYATRIPVR